MSRVLICTVGGSEAPVIHAVQQNRPDFVYFLCSGGQGSDASERTVDSEVVSPRQTRCPLCGKRFDASLRTGPIAAKAGLQPGDYTITAVTNPDDMDAVTRACAQIEADIQRRFEQPEVVANYTGGTKTMAVGLGLHAFVARGTWRLQVNATGTRRRDLVAVTVGDMALTQQVDELRINEGLRRAEELLARHDYDGAVEVLEAVARNVPPARAGTIATLRARSLMLSAWDRFEHEDALEIARGDERLFAEFGPRLKQILRARRLLASDGPWSGKDVRGTALVEDLLQSAKHSVARKAYDDAIARLYRATELLAHIALRRDHEVVPWSADPLGARLDPSARRRLQSLAGEAGAAGPLGLTASFRLLAALDDPLGRYFEDNEADLRVYLERRNFSLLAHGLDPVTGDEWRRVGSPWCRWIEAGARILEKEER